MPMAPFPAPMMFLTWQRRLEAIRKLEYNAEQSRLYRNGPGEQWPHDFDMDAVRAEQILDYVCRTFGHYLERPELGYNPATAKRCFYTDLGGVRARMREFLKGAIERGDTECQ